MNTAQQNKLGPFIVLIFIYFLVGFLTTVNGQCQAPLKIAFLMHAGELKNTFITLISFSFFLAYLLNGTLGYKWINKFGYKKTLIRGLLVMVCGLTVFFFSSWFTVRYENLNVLIAGAHIPYGYFIFLFGSYLMGTSATLLQVVINPYVAAYEVKGTQPVQRMNIVCAFNSFGTTIAPFFVTGVMFGGLAIEEVQVKQLMVPFLILAAFIAFTAFITQRLYLPDVMHTKAAKGEKLERSIWSFRHLTLGVIAIFFYVGAEVSIGVNVNLNALELENSGQTLSFFGMKHIVIGGIDFGLPALLATLYWGGLMVGRIVSSYLKHISPPDTAHGNHYSSSLLHPDSSCDQQPLVTRHGRIIPFCHVGMYLYLSDYRLKQIHLQSFRSFYDGGIWRSRLSLFTGDTGRFLGQLAIYLDFSRHL